MVQNGAPFARREQTSLRRKLWTTIRHPFTLTPIAVGILLFGVIGFLENEPSLSWEALSNALYATLRLFTLGFSWTPDRDGHVRDIPLAIHVLRIVAPVTAGFVAIRGILFLLRDGWRDVLTGHLRGHAVICGLGEKGMRMALSLRHAGRAVAAIEARADNPNVEMCRRAGVHVVVGDATSPEMLQRVNLPESAVVYALCNDAADAEIASRAREVFRTRRRRDIARQKAGNASLRERPYIFAHIESPELCAALREAELFHQGPDAAWLEFFSIYEMGARCMLHRHPPFGPCVNLPCEEAHIVLIGMCRFGEALLTEMATPWRKQHPDKSLRLPVTLVGTDAGAWSQAVCHRHQFLLDLLDLQTLENPDFWSQRETINSLMHSHDGRPSPSGVYVCLPDEAEAMQLALILQRSLSDADTKTRIYVRMAHRHGLCGLIHQAAETAAHELVAFAVLDEVYAADLQEHALRERLAQAIHNEYLEKRRRSGDRNPFGSKPADKPWEELAGDLRDSNRLQAQNYMCILRQRGYDIAPIATGGPQEVAFSDFDIEFMAQREHERWLAEKAERGYVHGPRDDRGKPPKHPDMLPYERLTEDVKDYDRNAVRNIPTVLAGIGYEVVRGAGHRL